MSLDIKFVEYGKWESPVFGAVIQLIERPKEDVIYLGNPIIETSKIIDVFIGSTYPNPFNSKKRELKLQDAYPLIVADTYRYKFGLTAHNKKIGFDINNNKKIPTVYPNPNPKSKYYGQYFANHVDAHEAWSDTWRGSHACLTVMLSCWEKMISYFSDGDKGNLEILRVKG